MCSFNFFTASGFFFGVYTGGLSLCGLPLPVLCDIASGL